MLELGDKKKYRIDFNFRSDPGLTSEKGPFPIVKKGSRYASFDLRSKDPNALKLGQ